MMWQVLFALALPAAVAIALSMPEYLENTKVEASHTLGTAYFFLGLSCSATKLKDLIGSSLGLGGPTAAINAKTAGGSLECSILLCLLSTPAAALVTSPYIYRHFTLLLLDQPPSPDASTADVLFRAHLSPDFPATAPGAVLSAFLPSKPFAATARRWSLIAAAAMVVVNVLVNAAVGAEALHAVGLPVLAGVLWLHAAALLLGYLIPAGVSSPGSTCRTTAYQVTLASLSVPGPSGPTLWSPFFDRQAMYGKYGVGVQATVCNYPDLFVVYWWSSFGDAISGNMATASVRRFCRDEVNVADGASVVSFRVIITLLHIMLHNVLHI
ncbi:hypothetical protein VOLCADRAFT_98136 [Volvox carteri f. nagariensis]|uniref:Uncharacterized protein n=1 Tax=Volvox carteri f. nagariensis TaxID=3068 RepID=D8UEJ4_VOLCA|nr:uncharacterized protein VOLCADRAFT_98136 [Volvox carteri f. nagariensis]EFJ41854.1 hypothetical protein VOLCADRAFT_98136 [Volvox carteri f. nagariensis]|eukprot:XP_002957052.1 hypothetical protein VOLCADRAFT_98136 [Volvox carteri f. nagariensis]